MAFASSVIPGQPEGLNPEPMNTETSAITATVRRPFRCPCSWVPGFGFAGPGMTLNFGE